MTFIRHMKLSAALNRPEIGHYNLITKRSSSGFKFYSVSIMAKTDMPKFIKT